MATIPANAGGVWYLPLGSPYPSAFDGGIDEHSISLRVAQGDQTTELLTSVIDRSLGFSFSVFGASTDAELPVGATLVVSAIPLCTYADGGLAPRQDLGSYEIVAAVPRPSAIGTLSVVIESEAEVPQPASAACSLPATTSLARLTIEPSSEAAPWFDAMVFETMVDGVPWFPLVTDKPGGFYAASQRNGGSWTGRGTDAVFAKCGTMSSGVSPGSHVVSMRGVLPDGTVLETEAHTIELACPPSSTLPDGGVVLDAGSEPDAGVPAEATMRGGSCAVGDAMSGRGAGPWLVVAFALGLRLRRRSRGADPKR